MRVLFISGELIGSAIVHKLIKEGHDVKLYIEHEDRKNCFGGMVDVVDEWKNELKWVGKDGLIIFDDVIFNGEQEHLRSAGYSVVGGDSKSDKLELNRKFFQDTLEKYGITTIPSYSFKTIDETMEYVKKNRDTWVIKHGSHMSTLNYVGQREDAKDVLDILKIYKQKNISIDQLQKRVYGVEIGVARYFNGNEWVGPIEINIEHKALCNDDIGPLTAEMGTLMWYEEDENLPLFKKTLSKIKDYLIDINYKGDVDINCIINKDKVWPLEATMRFGTPSTELQCELHKSPWGDFMKAVADGKKYNIDYHKGYGIVISIAVPPFPYAPKIFNNSNIETCRGVSVSFKEEMTKEEMDQIHFEEVSVTKKSKGNEKYYISGKHGYVLYVTGHGKTVKEAQKEAYGVVNKIIIPKMFYRTDIGDKFIKKDKKLLKKWGWI